MAVAFAKMSQMQSQCGNCDSAKQAGTVVVKFENEPEISTKDSEYEQVLEVIGNKARNNNIGVDIVMVLDESQCMEGDKLRVMKRAVQFVMKQLSPCDRLSIITYSSNAEKKWGFRPMTSEAQREGDILLQYLVANGCANLRAGLQIALNVLDDRKNNNTSGRNSCIMLMSSGAQHYGDATQIPVNRYPVFTFRFGTGAHYNPQVLKDIAGRSKGGKFNVINNPRNISDTISGILDWLLKASIQDVKLVIKPSIGTVSKDEKVETKINKVYAGKYQTSIDNATNKSVIVNFGNLKGGERHRVLVNLSLPKVTKEVQTDALQLFSFYRDEQEKQIKTNPVIFRVKRCNEPKQSGKHAKRVEMAKLELLHVKPKVVVKHGPYGSQLPENFSMTIERNQSIKEVIINHGYIVDGIGFVVQNTSGCPTTKSFGGKGGNHSKIGLKNGEIITQISGTSGEYSYANNNRLISTLKIHTNYCPQGYGPFGRGFCTKNVSSFASPNPLNGRIIGFWGNAQGYLCSLGIYVEKDC